MQKEDVGDEGNSRFTSSTNQFPLLAEEGDPGQELQLRLELKLLADVGIIGAPNAGKSSLLTAVSAARPKVASYPFTTLEPVLGVVEYEEDGFVMVDIPGLIEGAHAGAGLGDEFLRHVERTRVLDARHRRERHLILIEDYFRIRDELRLFDEELTRKPEVVAFNKLDIPGVDDAFELCKDELAGSAVSILSISAAGRSGLDELLHDVAEALNVAREREEVVEESVGQTVVPEAGDGDVPVLRPAPTDRRPEIRELGPGKYDVILRSATRFAGMVDLNNWGARVQFYEQLQRLGVISALERAGIQTGDTYVVGKHELEWE